MSTVQEILTAMDKLTPDELRVVKLGVDSRLADDDDDPAFGGALHEAIVYADAHPDESKSIDEVRAAHSKMDFRVEITDPGIDDLAEIVSYIAKDTSAFRLPARYINPNARTVASSTTPVASNP